MRTLRRMNALVFLLAVLECCCCCCARVRAWRASVPGRGSAPGRAPGRPSPPLVGMNPSLPCCLCCMSICMARCGSSPLACKAWAQSCHEQSVIFTSSCTVVDAPSDMP